MGTLDAVPVNGRVHLITPSGQVVELTAGRAHGLAEDLSDAAWDQESIELALPVGPRIMLSADSTSRLADRLEQAAEKAWNTVADSAAALSGEAHT